MFIMTLMFTLIVLFVSMVFYGEYNNFDEEAAVIQKKYIETQKETITFDTHRVLKFIRYMYDNRDETQNEKALKQQILHSLEQLYGRQDGTGYIFIYDFSGVVLSDPIQRQNIGKNLYEIEDTNGVKVIKDLIDVSHHPEGGFVEYLWLKPTTGDLSPKISYAQSFKEWGWMIGTGVYLDEVEKSISKQRRAMKQKLNKYMIDIIFLLGISFTFGVMGIVVANNILKREIDTFSIFFKEAATKHDLIDSSAIRLIEFKQMVTYINTMIDAIHTRKKKLTELNATLESKVEEKTKDLNEQNRLLIQEKNFSNSLLKAQDSFIKHSIHEINTPLAVIMTHIDLYKMKRGENRYLSKIEAASKIIANIYDDLSYMVKKDRFTYKKKTINFSEFLLERVDFFAEISHGNNHRIVIDIEEDIFLYFSPEELQRVIDNNISNSIKYANKNTDVKITLHEIEKGVVLSFLTYSPKIDDTNRIFKAFEREDNVKGGFGLGLEIVYVICTKEDIDIEVESDEKTTVFEYTFQRNFE